jgi:formyl-CoA transferase
MNDEPQASTGPPLEGLKVLDLSRVLTGPFASMILGDLGASVVKVEPPTGDETRQWGPPFLANGDGTADSTYFMSVNRNKKSVALDLKNEADLDLLWELIEDADVLIENYRPGVASRLGLGPAELWKRNAKLVILSITGFGHDGPDRDRGGYDQIAQAESGIMSLTGTSPDQPTKVGVPLGDLSAGMFGIIGVLAALRNRERTGRGDVVRTSLLASLTGLHAFQGTRYLLGGQVPRANGNHHPTVSPYGGYPCSDGEVQIAVGSQKLWTAFARYLGVDPDDARFADNGLRVVHRPELDALICARFETSTADEVLVALTAAGVPSGKVRSLDEVYASDQVASQGMVASVEHPRHGALRLTGTPIRFDVAGGMEHSPPPDLDEHGLAVRASPRTAW